MVEAAPSRNVPPVHRKEVVALGPAAAAEAAAEAQAGAF